jgi:toxin YoeB
VNLLWTPIGWRDFLYWETTDPVMARRILRLVEDVRRSSFAGLGKPEPLRDQLAGWWSRRITEEHRLVYRFVGKGDAQRVEIAQCRYHY